MSIRDVVQDFILKTELALREGKETAPSHQTNGKKRSLLQIWLSYQALARARAVGSLLGGSTE